MGFDQKNVDLPLGCLQGGLIRPLVVGRLQRFRDQGEAMDILAASLLSSGKRKEAERWMLRARKVGEEHGFFTVNLIRCSIHNECDSSPGNWSRLHNT